MILKSSAEEYSIAPSNSAAAENTSLVAGKASSLALASDSALWTAFVQGSEQALSELFERFANKLFNYGRQLTSDEGLVNDAVQDVFYQLIKAKGSLSIAHSVKHYLFSSFRRRLIRMLKQQKKILLDEAVGMTGKFQLSFTPDYYGINTKFTVDQKRVLENALNQLPPRQREILALYFFEGLSYKQIADIMEFSEVKSARKLLYRTLDGLGESLGKYREIFNVFLLFL